MTCLGFAPGSVGSTATKEREASPRIPSTEKVNRNLASDSPAPLIVAQATPKPSPTPTDTLPNLNKPKPAPRSTSRFGFLSSKWSLLWIGAAVVFFAIAGGLFFLQRRLDNQPDPKPEKSLPDPSPSDLDIEIFDDSFDDREIALDNNGYNNAIASLPESHLETPNITESNHKNNPFTALPEPTNLEPEKPAKPAKPARAAKSKPAKSAKPAEANNSNTVSPVPEKSQSEEPNPPSEEENIPVQETTRISKFHIVEALIRDLHSPDPRKRRKAIWELAQRGDSRAMQPLLDLLMDADSQQRSLILEALSQIGTRTLKPMNRALAVSLQDDNAEVRKNAIRDLTRMYESLGQLSQLLRHAVEDPDKDVQETARWALNQLSKIRTLPGMENLNNSKNPPPDF